MALSTQPETYRAIGYYRLSRNDSSAAESNSIANQRMLIRAYAERQENLYLVDEAYDDGYTGTNFDRPGFSAVLKAIEEGKANCVIVKDLSRLGREYIETGKYLETVFPQMNVRFIAINDDVDSEHSRNGDDILIPIKNIMNEAYCRELSKKLRRQFRMQRSNGEFMGAFAAYGYKKSTEDKHKLLPDEEAASVVQEIFSRKLQGWSNDAIAQQLNEQGILSPSAYKQKCGLNYKSGFAQSEYWCASSIRMILTNPLYMGTLAQGKRGTPNYKLKKIRPRNEAEWSVVENNHEPIIQPQVFHAVQRVVQRDTRSTPGSKQVQVLSGLLFCPDCGRAMCRRSVKRGQKSFHYYVCSTHKKGNGCTSHSISQQSLEETVLHTLQKQIAAVVSLEELLACAGQSKVAAAKKRQIEQSILEQEQKIEQFRQFRCKLYESLCDELISHEEYKNMKQHYGQKISLAQEALERLQKEARLQDEAPSQSFLEQFRAHKNLTALCREVAVTLIDRIEVFEDKRIQVHFNFRDEIEYYLHIAQELQREAV